MMADSQETARELSFDLLRLLHDKLEDDDFFVFGLAALTMAKATLLEFPGVTELREKETLKAV
jgi:hypothetical protein